MTARSRSYMAGLMLAGAVLAWQLGGSPGLGQETFDRLSAEDRQTLAQRFDKEIWPLLVKGDKNGCVGCHSGKIVSALKLTGKSTQDFTKMLKDGFFVPNDPGSLLSRILDTDKKRRMPPPSKGPRWSDADIKILQAFVDDLEKKQGKAK